jgi:hypothetical protein
VAPSKPPSSVDGNQLRVTLINHSTVLLQFGGFHVLTDPIWSERASPLAAIGPRRRRSPAPIRAIPNPRARMQLKKVYSIPRRSAISRAPALQRRGTEQTFFGDARSEFILPLYPATYDV